MVLILLFKIHLKNFKEYKRKSFCNIVNADKMQYYKLKRSQLRNLLLIKLLYKGMATRIKLKLRNSKYKNSNIMILPLKGYIESQ